MERRSVTTRVGLQQPVSTEQRSLHPGSRLDSTLTKENITRNKKQHPGGEGAGAGGGGAGGGGRQQTAQLMTKR